jgi:hypothetical protein
MGNQPGFFIEMPQRLQAGRDIGDGRHVQPRRLAVRHADRIADGAGVIAGLRQLQVDQGESGVVWPGNGVPS